MPYGDFYNINKNRVYPLVPSDYGAVRFLSGSYVVPDDLVIDCGFWLGTAADYDPGEDIIYLDTIARSGTTLTIVFTSTSGVSFTFTRSTSDLLGATEYVDSSAGASTGIGFLVTGEFSIIDSIADGTTIQVHRQLAITGIFESDGEVEPGLIQAETGSTLLSLTVGNLGSLADAPCGDCGTIAALDDTVYIQTSGLQLTGNIIFEAGYNTIVGADMVDSVITIQPSYGAGAGVLCGDPPLRHSTDAIASGERCGDLLYTINGIDPTEAGAFRLQGSTGVTVIADAGSNAVDITGQIGRLLVCE